MITRNKCTFPRIRKLKNYSTDQQSKKNSLVLDLNFPQRQPHEYSNHELKRLYSTRIFKNHCGLCKRLEIRSLSLENDKVSHSLSKCTNKKDSWVETKKSLRASRNNYGTFLMSLFRNVAINLNVYYADCFCSPRRYTD